jgi:DNA invertase Pin-like site-specific DNA recombinase
MTIRCYSRVSTLDQDPAAQMRALDAYGYEVLYVETGNGKRTNRPEWQRLLADLQPGDTVLFWKTDRFGRSAGHVISTLDELQARGVKVVSLTENFHVSTPAGRFMRNVLAAAAQYETELRAERCAAGIAAMKEREATGNMRPGKKRTGRPRVTGPAEAEVIRSLRVQGVGFPEIARTLKISESSARRAVHCA